MSKHLVICASSTVRKYYFEPQFDDMPDSIKKELIEEATAMAQKVSGIIAIGFTHEGDIYIEEQQEDVFVDSIGVQLEIKKFQQEKKEFLQALKIWFMIYRTECGNLVRDILLKQAEGMSDEEIIDTIYSQLGAESADIAEMLLG